MGLKTVCEVRLSTLNHGSDVPCLKLFFFFGLAELLSTFYFRWMAEKCLKMSHKQMGHFLRSGEDE